MAVHATIFTAVNRFVHWMTVDQQNRGGYRSPLHYKLKPVTVAWKPNQTWRTLHDSIFIGVRHYMPLLWRRSNYLALWSETRDLAPSERKINYCQGFESHVINLETSIDLNSIFSSCACILRLRAQSSWIGSASMNLACALRTKEHECPNFPECFLFAVRWVVYTARNDCPSSVLFPPLLKHLKLHVSMFLLLRSPNFFHLRVFPSTPEQWKQRIHVSLALDAPKVSSRHRFLWM
jgi:hypothetical protein